MSESSPKRTSKQPPWPVSPEERRRLIRLAFADSDSNLYSLEELRGAKEALDAFEANIRDLERQVLRRFSKKFRRKSKLRDDDPPPAAALALPRPRPFRSIRLIARVK
jgi:hypothetical protein